MFTERMIQTTAGTIRAIGCPGQDTAANYFNRSSFLDDNRTMILEQFTDTENMTCNLVRYCLQTGESCTLVHGVHSGRWEIAADQNIYYCDGGSIRCVHAVSREKRTVICCDDREFYDFTITNDARYLGLYWRGSDGLSTVGRLDAGSGELIAAVKPQFFYPYQVANHAMIHPTDPDVVFYSHEGATEYITNRMWTVRISDKTTQNVYVQAMTADHANGEFVGHEMWSYQGDKLYFVKYSHSPIKPTGLWYVTKDGDRSGCISDAYSYWHVSCSRDDKWLLSDTGSSGVRSKIILVSTQNGRAIELADVLRWPNHPGHPHPSFSPDGTQICFNFADEDNRLWVGVMDITNWVG